MQHPRPKPQALIAAAKTIEKNNFFADSQHSARICFSRMRQTQRKRHRHLKPRDYPPAYAGNENHHGYIRQNLAYKKQHPQSLLLEFKWVVERKVVVACVKLSRCFSVNSIPVNLKKRSQPILSIHSPMRSPSCAFLAHTSIRFFTASVTSGQRGGLFGK